MFNFSVLPQSATASRGGLFVCEKNGEKNGEKNAYLENVISVTSMTTQMSNFAWLSGDRFAEGRQLGRA